MALKVLLADDSMTAQNMGKKILTDAGFDVATVSNGAAAIKKVAEYKPNIIILDIYMPGYTGLEVCERVRATDTTVPVLLTVGKLEPFRQEDIENVHADAIIVKPFEATDLINTVQRFAGQADVAASKAPVPPPPTVAVPPPPPPAQLSDEDLAFLRGEIEEQVTPAPAANASNAGHAAAANPDFADLLAAPDAPAQPSPLDVPLNDFELPPLTQEDFDMLQQGAQSESAPAYQETAPAAEPAIEMLAPPAPVEPEPVPVAPAEMPVFLLDENLTASGEVPAVSVYGDEPVFAPAESAPAIESAPVVSEAPVQEAAMAAAMPAFEPAPVVQAEPVFMPEPQPAFAPEPAAFAETQHTPEEFSLDVASEPAAPIQAEPLMEPILEPAPASPVAEVAPTAELEPLELEQSGPQPTSEIAAPPEELAPAYEFIGAHGITPADVEIEAVTAAPVELEPEVFATQEPVLEVPAAEASVANYAAAADLLQTESETVAASTESVAPSIPLDLNYSTVAGVVHRVFDRYKSQMIADIVRELSKQK